MTISAEQINKLEAGLSKPGLDSMTDDVREWQNTHPYKALVKVVVLSFSVGDLPIILGCVSAALHHGYTLGYAAAQSESLEKLAEDGR